MAHVVINPVEITAIRGGVPIANATTASNSVCANVALTETAMNRTAHWDPTPLEKLGTIAFLLGRPGLIVECPIQ